MRHTHRRDGFSLMEINMAVFVMAVGIMSLVGLFPLGLRESYQGRADLQQSMFADYALNQLVALLSQTNLTWSEWKEIGDPNNSGIGTVYPEGFTPPRGQTKLRTILKTLPVCVKGKLVLPGLQSADNPPKVCEWKVAGGKKMNFDHYRIFFNLVESASDRMMGIAVRSTDIDAPAYENYTNNVLYYAEVMFQGDPLK